MTNVVKISALTIIFGTLFAAGVHQAYYLFVPQNIAYGLKRDGYELSAYSQEAMNNEIGYLNKLIVEKRKDQKPEALIFCQEENKPKTNYIAYCKSLYGKSLSNKEEFEIAKNWCAHKPEVK